MPSVSSYANHLLQIVQAVFSRLANVKGFEPTEPFDGTLFLLPYRFQGSPLSNEDTARPCAESVQQLFAEYVNSGNCEAALLFVKHVNEVKVHDSQGSPLFQIARSLTEEDATSRSATVEVNVCVTVLKLISCKQIFEELRASNPTKDECRAELRSDAFTSRQDVGYSMQITTKSSENSAARITQHDWLLHAVVDNTDSTGHVFNEPDKGHLLLPWTTIAFPRRQDEVTDAIVGKASVFLPISEERTDLPVVLHATFAVDSTRRFVERDDTWNTFLTSGPLVKAYIGLMKSLANQPNAVIDDVLAAFPNAAPQGYVAL